MAVKKLPSVILRAGEDRRVRAGHPWAFSNEILMDADAKAIPVAAWPPCARRVARRWSLHIQSAFR